MNHLNGAHAPNAPFTEDDWNNLQAAGFKTLKLLWPDHKKADMDRARSLGVEQIIVRLPGAINVYSSDAQAVLDEFGPDIVIELGNEPNIADQPDMGSTDRNIMEQAYHNKDSCFQHRFYIEDTLTKIKQASPTTKVISPGLWASPDTSYQWAGIDAEWLFTQPRLWQTYSQCDGIGVHVYHYTDWQPLLDKIWRYHMLFPGKRLYVTEYGINDIHLGQPNRAAADSEKVNRYRQLLQQCAIPARIYIDCLCMFIMGGTPDFEHYHVGQAMRGLANVV
jgi:hypothetical protein